MASKSENKFTNKPSSTTKKDVNLIRLHLQFDEISDQLIQNCYKSPEVDKALDLMKFARWQVAETFKKFQVEN